MCLRTGFSPINAIVLTGKTWYPELGAGTCGGTRVVQTLPARRVGVPRTWKGFGHEKSNTSASDRCHHRYHCLGDTITSSGVAGWLGCRSHGRTNCWYGDRWNSGRRPRPWPRLLLLPRAGRLLRCGCILRPLVLYGVSIRSVIARCDAEVRTTKVAERSAAFFVPTRVWLDATKRKSCAGRSVRGIYRSACAAAFCSASSSPAPFTSTSNDQNREATRGLRQVRFWTPNETSASSIILALCCRFWNAPIDRVYVENPLVHRHGKERIPRR